VVGEADCQNKLFRRLSPLGAAAATRSNTTSPRASAARPTPAVRASGIASWGFL